jgi:hypothetical protein
MTHTTLRAAAIAIALAGAALVPLLAGTPAEAKGKEHFSNDYTFDKPMDGVQGFSGAYYCSYVKTPKEQCAPSGKCKKVWILTQTCY